MTHQEALSLIDHPALRIALAPAGIALAPAHNAQAPTRWADLGCGSGTFTLALADLLAPGSTIEAIDLRPGIAAQTTPNGVTIHPRTADFTTLAFAAPDPANPVSVGPANPANPVSVGPANPANRAPAARANPAIIPDRAWPGTQPLAYDGILMANSLHYVPDQQAFLARLKTNGLLLIEYDIDMPVARWVPYPLSFSKATRLLTSTGYPRVQKLGTLPSAFGRSELYAALALPQE